MQKILNNNELEEYLKNNGFKNTLIVCGHSFYRSALYSKVNQIYDNNDIKKIYFDGFTPNPTYEEVCDGLKIFKENDCDSIIAIGGGSAIDVAKCIKLFSNMDDDELYLNQEIKANEIPFVTVPTTAGTGSEATHFAVIYYKGEKKSVAHESSIPDAVLFEPSFLKTLPLYQKKATMLDALSHSIESMWSVNSNEESIKYSKEAIELIMKNMDKYLENDETTFVNILTAANLAGKAINITKTTAGHAMCYKLTSLYGISHGHAAMLVNSELYPYMIENVSKCIDQRGAEHLKTILSCISQITLNNSLEESKDYFRNIVSSLDLYDVNVNENDINELVRSVNVERLSNHPIKLEKNDIREIYERLFKRIKESKNESNRLSKDIKK
jgi:alcohol dehydrogenase class IV